MGAEKVGFFSYRTSTQWVICLLTTWFLLNILDIVSTYQAIWTGAGREANPLMALLIGAPLLLITLKMLLVFAAARLVERMEARRRYCGLASLVVLNVYVALACANNLSVCLNG